MSLIRSLLLSLAVVASLSVTLGGCASRQDKSSASSSSATTKPYTLSTCIVSDEELGTMGKPVVYNYNGQEIKFCCSGCEDDFKKDPEKYLKKLAAKSATTKPATAG
jgi:YHS domain-containing protein